MFKRLIEGGVAGAAATLPMSGVVWGAQRLGVYRRKPPPEEVSEGTARAIIEPGRLPAPALHALKTAQHFGFGGAAGAIYGVLTLLVRPSALTGLLLGLGVWAVSYRGWLPALGIMPPPERDERGRAATMIVAHAVYGVTLGLCLRWWAGQERSR